MEVDCKIVDACDIRLTAYKDGRSFDGCRKAAKSLVPILEARMAQYGRVPWDDIMKAAEFDAVVYKLALKYLRECGYDIGDHNRQWVAPGKIMEQTG